MTGCGAFRVPRGGRARGQGDHSRNLARADCGIRGAARRRSGEGPASEQEHAVGGSPAWRVGICDGRLDVVVAEVEGR
jgi:hypothetical protein